MLEESFDFPGVPSCLPFSTALFTVNSLHVYTGRPYILSRPPFVVITSFPEPSVLLQTAIFLVYGLPLSGAVSCCSRFSQFSSGVPRCGFLCICPPFGAVGPVDPWADASSVLQAMHEYYLLHLQPCPLSPLPSSSGTPVTSVSHCWVLCPGLRRAVRLVCLFVALLPLTCVRFHWSSLLSRLVCVCWLRLLWREVVSPLPCTWASHLCARHDLHRGAVWTAVGKGSPEGTRLSLCQALRAGWPV